jgi:ankyrin repeat protein
MHDDLKFPLPAPERDFLDAAREGDPGKLRALLAKGVPVDVLDNRDMPWGQTALMHAAQGGHVEAVRFLLEAGSRVSTKDRGDHDVDRNRQPLHYAMLSRNIAVAAALLDARANPNAESHFGDTPLNVAIREDNIEGVRLLLRRGADVKLKPRSRHYTPPLSVAAAVGKPVLVRLLLEAGADGNATDSRGQTPLMYASMTGPVVGASNAATEFAAEMIEDLLRAGARVNHTGNGRTALSLAVIFGNCGAAKALLKAGADANLIYESLQRGTLLDTVEQRIRASQEAVGNEFDRETGAETKRLQEWQEMANLLREFGGKRASE